MIKINGRTDVGGGKGFPQSRTRDLLIPGDHPLFNGFYFENPPEPDVFTLPIFPLLVFYLFKLKRENDLSSLTVLPQVRRVDRF